MKRHRPFTTSRRVVTNRRMAVETPDRRSARPDVRMYGRPNVRMYVELRRRSRPRSCAPETVSGPRPQVVGLSRLAHSRMVMSWSMLHGDRGHRAVRLPLVTVGLWEVFVQDRPRRDRYLRCGTVGVLEHGVCLDVDLLQGALPIESRTRFDLLAAHAGAEVYLRHALVHSRRGVSRGRRPFVDSGEAASDDRTREARWFGRLAEDGIALVFGCERSTRVLVYQACRRTHRDAFGRSHRHSRWSATWRRWLGWVDLWRSRVAHSSHRRQSRRARRSIGRSSLSCCASTPLEALQRRRVPSGFRDIARTYEPCRELTFQRPRFLRLCHQLAALRAHANDHETKMRVGDASRFCGQAEFQRRFCHQPCDKRRTRLRRTRGCSSPTYFGSGASLRAR